MMMDWHVRRSFSTTQHHSEFSYYTRSGCGVASTPFSNVVHTHPPSVIFLFVLSTLTPFRYSFVFVFALIFCVKTILYLVACDCDFQLAICRCRLRRRIFFFLFVFLYSKHNSILYNSNCTCIQVQRSCQCTQSLIKKENLPFQNPAPTSQQAPNLYHQWWQWWNIDWSVWEDQSWWYWKD